MYTHTTKRNVTRYRAQQSAARDGAEVEGSLFPIHHPIFTSYMTSSSPEQYQHPGIHIYFIIFILLQTTCFIFISSFV